ncbi:MAG TPA: hypothetical protein VHS53_12830 [Mucilaginibacter sp.]|nr:hypothetical protein [Mucilaginibacter sp.]
MEVHHHPEVEKKGFKEYILEGLMIFIAVMMGFFAESIREHLSDRSKENEFMISMVRDLKADTLQISNTIKNYNSICAAIDTLLITLKSGEPDAALINRIVSQNFWAYTGFNYNNNTIQQLKSSGNFRLVQNKRVTDSILKYDNLENAFILNQYIDLKNTLMTYKYVEAKVIHYQELKSSDVDASGFNSADFTSDKNFTITTDKSMISTYYNDLFIHGELCHTFLRNLKWTYGRAARLITFIKTEYKLKDESVK